MTGSGVERRRAVPLSSSVPPAGAATSPPPSQVEGRSKRRTGLRWGLRTILVGGIAGAAWFISGAAAHAADHSTPAEAASGGLPVVSLVNGSGNGAVERPTTDAAAGSDSMTDSTSLLTGVAPTSDGTAVLDALSDSVAEQVTSLTTRPARQPSGTAKRIDHSITDDLLAAGGGVDGIVRVLAAPFRLTDGPAGTQGLLSPVARYADPIVRSLRPAADPLTAAEPADADKPDAGLSALSFAPATSHPLTGSALLADGVPAEPIPAAEVAGIPASGGSLLALQRFAAAHLPDALITATAMSEMPDRPEPAAPLRAHLGAVSGAPSSGSGAPSDGGLATVPSSVVDSAVAANRLPAATSVEVRRHDAEAPTVSPD